MFTYFFFLSLSIYLKYNYFTTLLMAIQSHSAKTGQTD